LYENFRIGEVIHIKMKPFDRYIKIRRFLQGMHP
jgi:hypothetical protein